ncbi:hypothetical protein RclHR1_16250002 [Rhizophagus clarus]|uniref:Uncharacterized protein n=1 Tax=Rhizophagus clarus TaxID=94130 RepID=A0A2Z6QH89_9GLOM|nr:hypothetical protein RclHR1_16250002 [Rhizophagus clarus]
MIFSDIETISEVETISESDPSEVLDEQMEKSNKYLFFTKFLSVTEVIHSAFPVEYSKTSPQRVATIFNILGWNNCLLND